MELFAKQSLELFITYYDTFSKGKYIEPDTLRQKIWAELSNQKLSVEPVVESVVEPVVESVVESVVEPVVEPVVEKLSVIDIKPFDKLVQGEKVDYSKLRVKLDKEKLTLPFLPKYIHYSGCQNLLFNGGLYTPCGKKIKNNGFCNKCLEDGVKYGTLHNRIHGPFKCKTTSFNSFISRKKYSIDFLRSFLDSYQLHFIELPIFRERTPSTNSDIECYEKAIELVPEQYMKLKQKNKVFQKAFKQGSFVYDEDGSVLGKFDEDDEFISIEC